MAQGIACCIESLCSLFGKGDRDVFRFFNGVMDRIAASGGWGGFGCLLIRTLGVGRIAKQNMTDDRRGRRDSKGERKGGEGKVSSETF